MSNEPERDNLITRREAIRRVSALLGGVALIGGSALLTGCREDGAATAASDEPFTTDEIAFLDEIAETILPATSTPGAKAAKTGAFMALMVTDSYDETEQQIFREGMSKLDEASRAANDASFMESTPQQRLALLERIDRESKEYMDAREEARNSKPAEEEAANEAQAQLPGQRQEGAPGAEAGAGGAPAITSDAPPHYFRMMKELAMLGYFTSEIGYTQAMRYVESPGRYDPCVPYAAGEKSWAPHA